MNEVKENGNILQDIVSATRDVLVVNKAMIEKFTSLDKKVKSIDENVNKKVKSIDENVDNKINNKILQHLSLKWQIYATVIALFALHVMIIPSLTSITVDKVLTEHKKEMKNYGDTLRGVKADVESLKKDVKAFLNGGQK